MAHCPPCHDERPFSSSEPGGRIRLFQVCSHGQHYLRILHIRVLHHFGHPRGHLDTNSSCIQDWEDWERHVGMELFGEGSADPACLQRRGRLPICMSRADVGMGLFSGRSDLDDLYGSVVVVGVQTIEAPEGDADSLHGRLRVEGKPVVEVRTYWT